DGGEGVPRLYRLVADEAEDVATHLVGARLGDDVDDAAGRAAELGREGVGDDLELLHRLLRHGRARGVDGVVGVVGTVHLHEIRAAALAAEVQTGGRRGADGAAVVARDGRGCQGEVDVVALVDGQVVDAHLVNGVRDVGL